jgi:hypothetical protein
MLILAGSVLENFAPLPLTISRAAEWRQVSLNREFADPTRTSGLPRKRTSKSTSKAFGHLSNLNI